MDYASSAIYDLPSKLADLPRPAPGIASLRYSDAIRQGNGSVEGVANFTSAEHVYTIDVPPGRRLLPHLTALIVEATVGLYNAAGAPLQSSTEQGIAPSMNLAANLFSSAQLEVGDKKIATCTSMLPQVAAIAARMEHSESWLKTIGSEAAMQAGIFEREALIAEPAPFANPEFTRATRADVGFAAVNTWALAAGTGVVTFAAGGGTAIPDLTGNTWFALGDYVQFYGGFGGYVTAIAAATITIAPAPAMAVAAAATEFTRFRRSTSIVTSKGRRRRQYWCQIPLGIFQQSGSLGPGQYRLTLTPNVTFIRQCAVEIAPSATATLATAIGAATGADFMPHSERLLIATVAHHERLDKGSFAVAFPQWSVQSYAMTAAAHELNFEAPEGTDLAVVAFQHSSAGIDARRSVSRFIGEAGAEMTLTSLALTLAGEKWPASTRAYSFAAGQANLTQAYLDSVLAGAGINNDAGSESMEDFVKRGPYYAAPFPRDATSRDRSMRVEVNFSAAPTNLRMLVFFRQQRGVELEVDSGRVVKVTEAILH